MYLKKSILVYLLLAVFIGFSSCDDDDKDTTGPVIKLISPKEEAVVAPGQNLVVEAEVSDDEELKSYKIDIHWGGDHHHDVLKASTDDETLVQWQKVIVGDFNEVKEAKINETIPVPANVEPGDYHLILYCTGASGVESKVWVTFEIEK